MASLDGLVPSTHGLTIEAPGMLNVWLGMEHQSILWCNQLVVQVYLSEDIAFNKLLLTSLLYPLKNSFKIF